MSRAESKPRLPQNGGKLVAEAAPPRRGAAFKAFSIRFFDRIRFRPFASSNQTQAFVHLLP